MRQDLAFVALNRGIVSRLGLARVDVKRIALSAETYNNYVAYVLGSMSIRPGLGYLGSTQSDAKARFLPFVFSTSDKASIELTDLTMRVWVDDEVITRPAVTTTITNGTFTTNLTGWTDNDEAGAVSQWVSPGYMELLGTGSAAAIRDQQITVAGANIGVEHGLKIIIARGPVTLRVGSTSGGDEYITETDLDTGVHSLAVTPTADFYIRFLSRLDRVVWVDSIAIESAGPMTVTTPWTEVKLSSIRPTASGDILFCAASETMQYKIERRATRSWSVVQYLANNGPFRVRNLGPTTMTPSVLSGNGTLTASTPTFRSGHLGALFNVVSTGQRVTRSVTAQNQFSNTIEITGVGSDREFAIVVSSVSGTGTTITLQRSFGAPGTWIDVTAYTADFAGSTNDGFDNQDVFYRIGCKLGDYSAGTISLELSTVVGSIRGIARVTEVTSSLVAQIEVLTAFGATTASDEWSEGKWSTYRGFPTSSALYEGRLSWEGRDTAALSVSDDYYSFDDTVEGDSGPIVRTIGSGPVETINWALALKRLMLGGQGAEFSVRSSALDEPLTPTNCNIKKSSRQGSAAVEAVEVDDNGVYVQRGGTRLFELAVSSESLDYVSTHLTAICPGIGKPGIVRLAVQRQPDTRIHCVKSDGTVVLLVFDKVESVTCFSTIDSTGADGFIEDVHVLPGDEGEDEDHVYYVVKRTIDGSTKRYFERWAFQEDCLGDQDDICNLADSYKTFGAVGNTITGADHLEGEDVVVWADGRDLGVFTVNGGEIDLGDEVVTVGGTYGLYYKARWKSGKLGQLQSQIGLALKAHKTLAQIGFILADTHRFGIKFGPDFDNLDDMPSTEEGAPVSDDAIYQDYDNPPTIFPGTYTVDSRICLQSEAPKPCTVLAFVAEVEHHG